MFNPFKKYRQQIADLKTTISTLQDQVSAAADKMEQLNKAYNLLYHERDSSKPWYEDDKLLREADGQTRHLAHNIKKDQLRSIARTMPAYKPLNSYTFHGGCLGCSSQRVHGLGRCLGCCYFGSGGTDLSIK